MPGSRIKEVNSLLPVIMESVEKIKAAIPECQFILPLAHTISHNTIPDLSPRVVVVENSEVYNVMSICDLMILASGTASLEAAYTLTPMIVIYKVSAVSWAIMNMLVKSIKSTALPNIIADKPIVPELLQTKAEPHNIAQITIDLLRNPHKLQAQKVELQKVRKRLGQPGAVERTAKLVLQYVR